MEAPRFKGASDFKRVARALANPDAIVKRWGVKTFGYCAMICRKPTEYREEHFPLANGTISHELICLECCKRFGKTRNSSFVGMNTGNFDWYYTNPNHPSVPARAQEEIIELLSRDVQRAYFFEALGKVMVDMEEERMRTADKLTRINLEIKRLETVKDFSVS